MATTAIIHFIQGLSLEEQNFVIEQILRLRQEGKQKQAGFTEIGTDYVPSGEIATISAVPEEVLVLPDWQKKILQQRLESVEQGNTVSQKEAHKIFEQCLA